MVFALGMLWLVIMAVLLIGGLFLLRAGHPFWGGLAGLAGAYMVWIISNSSRQ